MIIPCFTLTLILILYKILCIKTVIVTNWFFRTAHILTFWTAGRTVLFSFLLKI